MPLAKELIRKKRHARIRKKVFGSPNRPRLCVSRSHLNLSAQIVDDFKGQTLLSMSTLNPEFKKKTPYGGNVLAAKVFGHFLAEAMKKKSIEKIVFDSGGYPYHGRIKMFADSLREKGVQF